VTEGVYKNLINAKKVRCTVLNENSTKWDLSNSAYLVYFS